MKYIGRLFNIGMGRETARGVATAAAYWIPTTSLTFDEETDQVTNEQSRGVIEDATDQNNTAKRGKGSMQGLIHDQSFGALLLNTFGTESGIAVVESGVSDHTFSVLETAQHPSFTITIAEPQEASGKTFPLGMFDKMEIDVGVGKYSTFKGDFSTNKGTSTAETQAYTAQNIFLPQYGSLYLASTYAGLSGASVTANIKTVQITISKNTEDDITIGNLDPIDRLNKQFAIEGQIEATYVDRSWIDTYLLADVSTALRVKLLNSDILIGAASHPTITFDLAKCKMKTVARKIDQNNIVTVTVKFKAYYSPSDSTIGQIVLRNTRTSYY